MKPSPGEDRDTRKTAVIVGVLVVLLVICMIGGGQVQILVKTQFDRSLSAVLLHGPLPGLLPPAGAPLAREGPVPSQGGGPPG